MRSDITLMENDYSKMILSQVSKFSNSIVIPTVVNDEDIAKSRDGIDRIDSSKSYTGHFAFNGDFTNVGDVHNLEYLVSDFWPAVSESFPDSKLDLFGNNISKKVIEICQSNNKIRPVVFFDLQGANLQDRF